MIHSSQIAEKLEILSFEVNISSSIITMRSIRSAHTFGQGDNVDLQCTGIQSLEAFYQMHLCQFKVSFLGDF